LIPIIHCEPEFADDSETARKPAVAAAVVLAVVIAPCVTLIAPGPETDTVSFCPISARLLPSFKETPMFATGVVLAYVLVIDTPAVGVDATYVAPEFRYAVENVAETAAAAPQVNVAVATAVGAPVEALIAVTVTV